MDPSVDKDVARDFVEYLGRQGEVRKLGGIAGHGAKLDG